ncbi:LysR family transcriptional regulator [Nocardia gamkensis]|uniref:LysR family transcriptional regulator n=1 Tax=Nocardia gamkensis TaxID=352869 RepID=UPI0037CC8432
MVLDVVSLQYFLVVAQERNFTRAAGRLGIAQPALSARVRRLEHELGVQLLIRTTRIVQLTPAGVALLENGPDVLSALEWVWELARRAGHGEYGLVRVGHSASAGVETVPVLIEAVSHRYPDLRLTAEPMPTPQISLAVADGRIDVGITRAEQPGRGVRRFRLRRERLGVQVSIDHPLGGLPEVAIDDVVAYPVLLHERESNPAFYDNVVGLFHGSDRAPRIMTPAMSFDLSQRALRTGAAVGFAGEGSAAARPPGLTWIPVRGVDAALSIYLVLPRDPNPLQRRVREVAKEVAAEHVWLI